MNVRNGWKEWQDSDMVLLTQPGMVVEGMKHNPPPPKNAHMTYDLAVLWEKKVDYNIRPQGKTPWKMCKKKPIS